MQELSVQPHLLTTVGTQASLLALLSQAILDRFELLRELHYVSAKPFS